MAPTPAADALGAAGASAGAASAASPAGVARTAGPRRPAARAAAPLVAAVALVVAACGSGSSAGGRRSTTAAPTTTARPSLGAPSSPTTTAARSTAVVSAGAPCAGRTAPATYDHVVIVVLENHDYSQVAGHSPYLNGLAAKCGLATDAHAVSHPSLPNYIALTSGGTQGITTDCTDCPTGADSIFNQVGAAGWKSYEEDLPTVGFTGASSGKYAKKHNPAAYFTTGAAAYRTDSVPMGTPDGGELASDLAGSTLPRFAFLTPNLCDDEHDCPVATGDAWLSRWLPKVFDSPLYRAGSTALFVTYDESDNGAGNHVYTVAAAPSVPPGTTAAARFDHYSLLATMEDALHLPRLANAGAAASMRSALHV
ncbi:MAG: alkaline phosphatase family protein [Acidimicrobiales bacterium]